MHILLWYLRTRRSWEEVCELFILEVDQVRLDATSVNLLVIEVYKGDILWFLPLSCSCWDLVAFVNIELLLFQSFLLLLHVRHYRTPSAGKEEGLALSSACYHAWMNLLRHTIVPVLDECKDGINASWLEVEFVHVFIFSESKAFIGLRGVSKFIQRLLEQVVRISDSVAD